MMTGAWLMQSGSAITIAVSFCVCLESSAVCTVTKRGKMGLVEVGLDCAADTSVDNIS